MNLPLLLKILGAHLLIIVAMFLTGFIKFKSPLNSAPPKPNAIPMRVVAPTPPPPPPAPKPPPKKVEKPKPKPEPPKVVEKPKPKPEKAKPKPEKPKVEKKVAQKPEPKPKPKPKPEPKEELVDVADVIKPQTPEELFNQLQNHFKPPQPQPPRQQRPDPRKQEQVNVAKAQPVNHMPSADRNALRNRLEQTCLAGSWARNKPNGIFTRLNAVATVRVHKDGRVTFAKLSHDSGNPRMDEAVKRTVELAGCRFPLPVGSPEFIDLKIEFQLN